MDDVKWIDALSARATYGVAGNSPYLGSATVFDVLRAEQIPNYSYPVIGGPATQLESPSNKKLSWEATRTINLGVDAAMFNDRLSFSVDYYRKKTYDLLGQAPVNYFTGFAALFSNIGNLVNNGLNISLNTNNITRKQFTWTTGFVFGLNQSKLVSYELPTNFNNTAAYKLTIDGTVLGYPLSPLFAYKYAGLNAQGDPQIQLADGKVTSDPNAATANDVVYKGTVTPKFSGGLTNYFRYKQFGLSINIIYNLGDVMRLDVARNYNDVFLSGMLTGSTGIGGNISVDFLKRWQKPGDEKTTNIPRYLSVENYDARNLYYFEYADVNVASGAFVKMREAAFSYTLSPAAAHVLKLESAELRLQLSNVMLWKANKAGIDPEYYNSFGTQRVMPVGQHAVSFGVNVNF